MRDGVKAFHFRKKSPVAVLAAETVARDCPQDHSQESQNANEIGHGAGTSDWRKVFGKKPPNKARCHEQKHTFSKYQSAEDSSGEHHPPPVSIKGVSRLAAVKNPNGN